MKRFMAAVVAAVMVLSLAACAGETGTKTVQVGVAIYDSSDRFMSLYQQELQTYLKSLETDAMKYDITVLDAQEDPALQSQQMDDLIAEKMDVILLNPVQTSTAEVLIDKAVAADIPLVLINREPRIGTEDESYPGILDNPKVCYVGADARQAGTFQGELLRDQRNHADMNGDGVVSYVMIQGDPENPDTADRSQFCISALTDAGIEVQELACQPGNWHEDEAQEIAASALAEYGDQIDVIICNNDSMAMGAASAIRTCGRTVGKDILLVGVDALEECQDMVRAGTMTGTVLNDYVTQSHKAVDVAIEALRGTPIEDYYWVDYVKVDQNYLADLKTEE